MKSKFLNWIEKHISKLLSLPLSISSIQFILTLLHMINEGNVSHDELEVLLQASNGSSMIMLALALAYIKFKKK